MLSTHVIKIFELSWLDASGKPVYHPGVITWQSPLAHPSNMDTFALKEACADLNFASFDNTDALKNHLMPKILSFMSGTYSGLTFEIFSKPERSVFFQIQQRPGVYIRKLCPLSAQPDVGLISVQSEDQQLLSKALTSIQSLADKLYNTQIGNSDILIKAAQDHADENICLGIHMARRGGISYSAFAYSSKQASAGSSFIFRSSIE